MGTEPANLRRLQRYWDKHSRRYDEQMGWAERRFFADTRQWVCRQADGEVLEVAIGTGLNLDWYPDDIELTGVDLSPAMLERARRRVERSGRDADLSVGDAQRLSFADESFDTVVCTFSLCAIPDERQAIREMVRVLRPGGRLLLADHVIATSGWLRLVQRVVEFASVPIGGEHFRRRPAALLPGAGLVVGRHDRFRYGAIERVVAHKPDGAAGPDATELPAARRPPQ